MPTPSGQIVLVDANVWYSRTLRDWIAILYLQSDTPLFTVCWTEDILAEVLYHLRRNHPDWEGGRITKVRESLAGTFEVGRVIDFPSDSGYRGTDPHDAHIHGAALACGADILLTCDTSGFIWDENTSPYEVMHPDDFLVLVDDSAPALVAEATLSMCRYWVTRAEEFSLPARLKAAGCPQFAERVRRHLQAQSGALASDL